MGLKIIKSKPFDEGTIELFEHKNNSEIIIGYSVLKTYRGKNVIGGGVAKIESSPKVNGDQKDMLMDKITATNIFINQT